MKGEGGIDGEKRVLHAPVRCNSVCGAGWTDFTTLHGLSSYHDNNNIVALVFVLVLLPQDLVNLCAHMVHREQVHIQTRPSLPIRP